jgi:hypothetical protein
MLHCGDGGIQTHGWQRWLDPDGAGIAARAALAGGSKRGLLDPGGAGGEIQARAARFERRRRWRRDPSSGGSSGEIPTQG